VKDLKDYAKEAGGDGSHLPRTRCTFARIVSVLTGDITATQSALDRQNRSKRVSTFGTANPFNEWLKSAYRYLRRTNL